MAKTIEELALEAYPIKMVKTYGILPGGDITEKDENLPERMAMEKGANAVIKAIEEVLPDRLFFSLQDGMNVVNIIKELKGEMNMTGKKKIDAKPFSEVFSQEQIDKIDSKIMEAKREQDAKLYAASLKAKDFHMNN